MTLPEAHIFIGKLVFSTDAGHKMVNSTINTVRTSYLRSLKRDIAYSKVARNSGFHLRKFHLLKNN